MIGIILLSILGLEIVMTIVMHFLSKRKLKKGGKSDGIS